MPVSKCSNGKWRVGNGNCVFDTKSEAESAQAAIKAEQERQTYGGSKKKKKKKK